VTSPARAIRPATKADLPAITRIYNAAIEERTATCHLQPRTLAERQRWWRRFDDRHPVFVTECEGQVLCYGCLTPYSSKEGYRFATEHSLYVAPEARGQGLGREMLTHLMREAKRLGYHYMEGGVFAHNPASLALHESLGFERMGTKRQVANLDGHWADVVLMVKLLGPNRN
jgi:phosphinothricin acetyltransferase